MDGEDIQQVEADAVDAAAVAQEKAREGVRGEAPLLQSPLRDNELRLSSGTIRKSYARPLSETLVGWARRAGRIALQLALIVSVCLAGDKLSEVLPLDVPGNICSMVLLLAFLLGGVIKMESISEAADFLLDNMAVFFVPAAVAVMGVYSVIENVILKLVVVTLLTTVIVFFVTSFTVTFVSGLMARAERRRAAGAEEGDED